VSVGDQQELGVASHTDSLTASPGLAVAVSVRK
jgi:hypothetical protein